MHIDGIKEVGIDNKGRLYVAPKSDTFPMIYREAMEVHWDVQGCYLFAPPPPRSELATPIFWYRQIIKAAKEQSCHLQLRPDTNWLNIPETLKAEIVSASAE
jgi:hypothetical protein